jgi:acetyl-CoA synthetase
MSNIESYEDVRRNFSWDTVRRELEYEEGTPLNIGFHCTDRICGKGKGEKFAMIWENFAGDKKTFTFEDLRVISNTYAKFLQELGLKEGDRVCVFMDRIPELYLSFLGILKAGMIAMPLFSAFGEDALYTRMEDADASAIFTTKKHLKKVRKIRETLPQLKHIIVVDDIQQTQDREIVFQYEKAEPVKAFTCAATGPETPSVLHYTSGTTGKPKGALHVHSSLLSQYITSKWVLDLRDDDVYWCTADPGWVTGTSYGIIGPWSNGVTQVVLDCGFVAERWYKLIEKHKVTVWYSAPTAIRHLMKEGEDLVKRHNLSSLRHLCSVGEPLNPEAVIWSREVYGLPFHDTWWQTETGAIMVTNFPGVQIKPGSMGLPIPGIEATVLGPDHKPLQPGRVGILSLKPPWPSMFRTYWENQATYDSKFKNGWYVSGDRAKVDEDGYFWFVGRDDDVINTAGHLVGPFEIESALLEHEAVAESAAIGKPDPVNMEVVKAFVALKPGYEHNEDLELGIMNFIRKKLSPLAMPQEIEFVDSLPKTRSGKILRRVLKAKETGEPIGDLSTLEDD